MAGAESWLDRDGYGPGRRSTPGFRFATPGNGTGSAGAKDKARPGRWTGDPASLQGRLLALLRRGRALEHGEIVDRLWGDREDGGPLDTQNVIGVAVHRLRHLWGWPIENQRHNVFYLDPHKVTDLIGQMHWPVGLTVAVWYPGHALHARACFVTGEARRLQFAPAEGAGNGRRIGLKGAAPVLDLGLQVPCRAIDWRDPQSTGAVFAMAPQELRVIAAEAGQAELRRVLAAAEAAAGDVSRETCDDGEDE